MQIQKRSMNWIPKRSLYNEMAMNRSKLKANARAYLEKNAAIADTFSQIVINDAVEAGSIASRMAMGRIVKTA